MALPSNVQWEVRPAGSDSNGGGFVSGASGTDFSQQDAAQYSFTDLAVDSVTNTKVTSASHNFVAADVGNLMHITAGTGWTQGFYQIVSVASNAATLDRSPAATSTTGGTFAVGGGLLTVGKPIGSLNSSLNHAIWVKAGTYTVTAVAIDLTAVTSVTGLTYQGYNTSHGDSGTRPLITTATNSIKLVKCRAAANLASLTFRNISFSNTAGTRDDGIYASTEGAGGMMLVDTCLFDGFVVAIRGDFSTDYYWNALYLHNSEFKNCSSHGVTHVGNTVAQDCWSHANSGDGFSLFDSGGDNSVATTMVLISCTCSGNNYGARQGGGTLHSLIARNCDFYNNTLDGLNLNNSRAYVDCENCIFDSNGQYGLSSFDAPGLSNTKNCAFRNNTTASHHNVPTDASDITLTAIPFTNAGAGDFSLNSTAGGGAACKAAGFPGVAPFGTGSLDVGALQSSGGGGSTTTYVIAPNQTRFVGNEEP